MRRTHHGLSLAAAALAVLGLAAVAPMAAQARPFDGLLPPMSPSAMPAFPHPLAIDNALFPLVPGTEYLFRGEVTEGGESTPHEVAFTVTDVTKEVNGVQTRVVWDRDSADGVLEEQEIAFFAQDADGNVWTFGEYPEVYEEGVFVGAPDTWITGVRDARGGLHMLASPQVGDGYVEGRVRSIAFYDVTEVVQTEQSVCVRAGCFDGVLVTHETSPLDAGGGIQVKHYAPGVGLVLIEAIGGDAQERLELVKAERLSPRDRQAANRAALGLDARAYENSALYGKTAPASL